MGLEQVHIDLSLMARKVFIHKLDDDVSRRGHDFPSIQDLRSFSRAVYLRVASTRKPFVGGGRPRKPGGEKPADAENGVRPPQGGGETSPPAADLPGKESGDAVPFTILLYLHDPVNYDRIAAKTRPRVKSFPENDVMILAPATMNRTQIVEWLGWSSGSYAFDFPSGVEIPGGVTAPGTPNGFEVVRVDSY